MRYLYQAINSDVGSMLLYLAAYHRVCSELLDRIYGVIQGFRFKLGALKESDISFIPRDLEA